MLNTVKEKDKEYVYSRNKMLNTVRQKDTECLYSRKKYAIIQKGGNVEHKNSKC